MEPGSRFPGGGKTPILPLVLLIRKTLKEVRNVSDEKAESLIRELEALNKNLENIQSTLRKEMTVETIGPQV